MSFQYKGSTTFSCNYQCMQCSAQTKNETRCKRTTCKYLPYCYTHLKSIKGVVVKPSAIPNAGDGLYALKKFKPGDKILDYTGEVLNLEQRNKRYGTSPSDYAPYGLETKSTPPVKIVDAACKRCAAAYANDRRGQPPQVVNNAKLATHQGKGSLKAIKNINPGQEIYVGYGPAYWAHLNQENTPTVLNKKGKVKNPTYIVQAGEEVQ